MADITRFLFQDAIDSLKSKIRDGECRVSLSAEDWDAKLPPIEAHRDYEKFAPLGAPVENFKFEKRKRKPPEKPLPMPALLIAREQAAREAQEQPKQLALF